MNSYDLRNTENGTTFSKLQHELYFRDDRSIQVSHFHMRSRNRIAQKCQSIFLPVSIFAYVGTTAYTVNNKSKRCRSLGFFLFPLEQDMKNSCSCQNSAPLWTKQHLLGSIYHSQMLQKAWQNIPSHEYITFRM